MSLCHRLAALAVAIALLSWLMTSFVQWNINPAVWSEDVRLAMMFATGFGLVTALPIVVLSHDRPKR